MSLGQLETSDEAVKCFLKGLEIMEREKQVEEVRLNSLKCVIISSLFSILYAIIIMTEQFHINMFC